MLLTQKELKSLDFIRCADGGSPKGWRGATYDTRVGEIITRMGVHDNETYTLKPRGIVWLLSAEDYKIPQDVTGITTLRTGWTKKGLLTLTAGIVDSGYEGPLSTAVINFSGKEVNICKGEVFFRTAFMFHEKVDTEGMKITRDEYREKLIKDSTSFSESFLTIDTLAPEIAPKILGAPRMALYITLTGLGLALLGLLYLPLKDLTNQVIFKNLSLEERIEALEKEYQAPPVVPPKKTEESNNPKN